MTDDNPAATPGGLADRATPLAVAWGEEKRRTITWHDPRATAAVGLQMAGLEYLNAMADGSVPTAPIAKLFGMQLVRAEPGVAEFKCVPDDSSYNPFGIVQGGLACTVLDTAAGCAVHTTLPAGVGYTSMEIKVNYMRPIHAGMELTITGTVTKPGKRIAFAEAEIRDPEGRLVANATSTLLIFGG